MTSSRPHVLPPLSQEELRHSEALGALIAAEVQAAGGWLSFERYMELALYAPGLGYYSAGSVKFGAQGDFVTAPEVSELFGRCVARQCAQVLAATDGQILELGAGTGRLAATLLSALEAAGALPERYAILEVSADLAERQRAHLARLPAHLRDRVVWLTHLPEAGFRGVMLANEVADALPCRRFTLQQGALRELGVTLDAAGVLHEAPGLPAPELLAEWALLQAQLAAPLAQGYTSEICLRAGPWIASLADALAAGALLVFDYGLPRQRLLPCAAPDGHAALPFPPPRARRSATSTSACRTSPPGSTSPVSHWRQTWPGSRWLALPRRRPSCSPRDLSRSSGRGGE